MFAKTIEMGSLLVVIVLVLLAVYLIGDLRTSRYHGNGRNALGVLAEAVLCVCPPLSPRARLVSGRGLSLVGAISRRWA